MPDDPNVGGNPNPNPNPNPGAATPWYQGADAELIGHIQTKGWHEKTASEAALEAVRAHREAERHIGIPSDQIMRAPKDANDEAAYKAIYGRLGVPDSADKYDFSGVKFSDGAALDANDVAFFQGLALKMNLPAGRAAEFGGEVVKYIEGAESAEAAETTAAVEAEKKALASNWGPNYDANRFLAQQGVKALGLDPEAVMALEGKVGYAKVMEAMRKVGELAGEGRYIQNGQPNLNTGVMTREQAVARKSELMSNQEWAKAYLQGDKAKEREMTALNQIIVGDDGTGYSPRRG